MKTRPTEAKQAVIATKGRFPMGPGPNDNGLSRRHLNQALNASLRRLDVEHIDLYQMHAWDALTPIEETLRFLDDAVSAGKIGYYGFSNYLGWHIAKASEIAKANGYSRPVTLQPQYNLLMRDIELEIVAACQDAGMGLLPWSPLGGGWLTGKYPRDRCPQAPPGSAKTRTAAARLSRPAMRRSGPGRSSALSRRSPGPAASAWPKWHLPGQRPGRR